MKKGVVLYITTLLTVIILALILFISFDKSALAEEPNSEKLVIDIATYDTIEVNGFEQVNISLYDSSKSNIMFDTSDLSDKIKYSYSNLKLTISYNDTFLNHKGEICNSVYYLPVDINIQNKNGFKFRNHTDNNTLNLYTLNSKTSDNLVLDLKWTELNINDNYTDEIESTNNLKNINLIAYNSTIKFLNGFKAQHINILLNKSELEIEDNVRINSINLQTDISTTLKMKTELLKNTTLIFTDSQ